MEDLQLQNQQTYEIKDDEIIVENFFDVDDEQIFDINFNEEAFDTEDNLIQNNDNILLENNEEEEQFVV